MELFSLQLQTHWILVTPEQILSFLLVTCRMSVSLDKFSELVTPRIPVTWDQISQFITHDWKLRIQKSKNIWTTRTIRTGHGLEDVLNRD